MKGAAADMRMGYESQKLMPGTVLRLVLAALWGLGYGVAVSVFSGNPQTADAYAEIVKLYVLIVSGALSYLPFAAAELLLYGVLIGLTLYLIFVVLRLILYPGRLARLLRVAADLASGGLGLLLLFYLLFGYSYHCSSVADKLDLDVRPQAADVLYDTAAWLLDEANAYAVIVPRDAKGEANFGSFEFLAARIPQGYSALAAKYEFLRSTYAPVKAVRSWRVMSSFGITGIYVPYTAESLVNPDNTPPALPFTMAHEMAHRLTVAPEDEANFIAFLACRANEDRRVAYSGYFMAYRYCIGALWGADQKRAQELIAKTSPELLRDMQALDEQIRKYEGPLQDVGTAVNDTYLKANRQTAGVQSYGQMVDLLIALYTAENPQSK